MLQNIFLNASEYISEMNVSEGMDNVIKLIVTDMADDGFTRKLKKSVKDVVNEKGNEIMTLQEHIKDVERITEIRKNIETAKKMLEKDYAVEDICDITGLSKEQVLKLSNKKKASTIK